MNPKINKAQLKSMLFAMCLTLIALMVPICFAVVELATEQVVLPEEKTSFAYTFDEGEMSLNLLHSTLYLDLSLLYDVHMVRLEYYNVLTPWWLKNAESSYFLLYSLWEYYDACQKEEEYQINALR